METAKAQPQAAATFGEGRLVDAASETQYALEALSMRLCGVLPMVERARIAEERIKVNTSINLLRTNATHS